MEATRERILRDSDVDVSNPVRLTDRITLYRVPGGKAAIDIWHRLAGQAEGLRGWPVLCGDPEDLEYLQDALDSRDGASPDEVLANVPAAPPLSELKESREESRDASLNALQLSRLPEELRSFLESPLPEPQEEQPDYAQWPPVPPLRDRLIAAAFRHSGMEEQPLAECLLALVAGAEPSDVPAYFTFGGFNDCPSSCIHVAFLRDWHKRYGAVPIAVTADVIELFVPRPPMSREEAFGLAMEQELYAPDIVSQGTQTMNRLAIELWQAPYWFFWWD